MTDLLTASRSRLLTSQPLLDLIGSGPQSTLNPTTSWDHWVFNDMPKIRIENTQKSMIVLTYAGGWASPNPHNTMRFPRLRVDVWADPTRTADGSMKYDDGRTKVLRVFEEVDRLLHVIKNSMPDPANPGQSMPLMWGTDEEVFQHKGLRINGSQALDSEPDLSILENGNGVIMGRKYYGISL